VQVSCANAYNVVGVNAAGGIYKYEPSSNGWTQLPGALTWVSIRVDGTIWVSMVLRTFTAGREVTGLQYQAPLCRVRRSGTCARGATPIEARIIFLLVQSLWVTRQMCGLSTRVSWMRLRAVCIVFTYSLPSTVAAPCSRQHLQMERGRLGCRCPAPS